MTIVVSRTHRRDQLEEYVSASDVALSETAASMMESTVRN
jgi:hypothetical protein